MRTFVVGLDRNEPQAVSHLYEVFPGDKYRPMCARGWNRSNGFGFSIFRGHAPNGICKVCQRRRDAGEPSVPAKARRTKWL